MKGLTIEQEKCMILKYRSGDKNAIVPLLQQYKPAIHSIIGRFSKYKYAHEDILGQAYIGFIECVNKYDLESNNKFFTYFYRYIGGYIYSHVDRRVKKHCMPSLDDRRLIDVEGIEDTVDYIINADKSVLVHQIIKILPKRDKYMVEQYYFKNKLHREIANDLNITPQAVSMGIRRSLKRLKEYMVSMGVNSYE